MKYTLMSMLSAVTVLLLTGCGQTWVSGKHVPPSKLPSSVVNMVDYGCVDLSDSHPRIISAVTGTDKSIPIYKLVVKGHFAYNGHTADELHMNIYKNGSAGDIVGNKAFDQTFVHSGP